MSSGSPGPQASSSSSSHSRPLSVSVDSNNTNNSSNPASPSSSSSTPTSTSSSPATTPNGTPTVPRSNKKPSYLGAKLENRKNQRRTLRGNGTLIWKPDSHADYCPLCGKAFNLFVRKHHCRKCGNIFCDACSDHKINVPEHGFNKPVRVCSQCAEAGFFLSPGEGSLPKPFIEPLANALDMTEEEKLMHEQFQQQHLANLKERKRDYTAIKEVHTGPMPTASSVQTFSLPAFAKMLPLSDGSVIQRGLLNFTIRSTSGKACAINPVIPYIPTSQRTPNAADHFITKAGRFKKMSYGDTANWNDGELKLKGIELSWDVEGEGEGWARMGAGSHIKVLEGKENYVVEVSTFEATTQMWNLINGMAATDKPTKICVYFRFETEAARDQWVLSLKHNMFTFLSTHDCFVHTRQKFIAYCRQVGVIGAEEMNWQDILDALYISK